MRLGCSEEGIRAGGERKGAVGGERGEVAVGILPSTCLARLVQAVAGGIAVEGFLEANLCRHVARGPWDSERVLLREGQSFDHLGGKGLVHSSLIIFLISVRTSMDPACPGAFRRPAISGLL